MPRRRPKGRLDDLLAAATRVFIARGYRRTQMADVAAAMGASAGALYGYVEGKKALFHLLIDRDFADASREPPQLPVRNPAPGATLERLRERLRAEVALPRLRAALARHKVADPRAELEEVLRELYELVERTRLATALIERSALDVPELAQLFYVEMRRDLLARLARYLERRIADGALRPLAHPEAAARLVLETVTWFARHRHGDADSEQIDDATARETTIDFLLAGLLRPPVRPAARRTRR